MNPHLMMFIVGVVTSYILGVFYGATSVDFQTIETLSQESKFNEKEVGLYFVGEQVLRKSLSVSMGDIYLAHHEMQEKARHIHVHDEPKIEIKNSWSAKGLLEKKTCLESPEFKKPIRGYITSQFGRRIHPVSGKTDYHSGIDWRGRVGTPIVASAPGRVRWVDNKGHYGKTVILEHKNGFSTLYGHLSSYAVKEGDVVIHGQTIAYTGRTGRATGPHLHFELRCDNIPIRPNRYFNRKGLLARVSRIKYQRKYLPQPKVASRFDRIPLQMITSMRSSQGYYSQKKPRPLKKVPVPSTIKLQQLRSF